MDSGKEHAHDRKQVFQSAHPDVAFVLDEGIAYLIGAFVHTQSNLIGDAVLAKLRSISRQ